MIERTLDRLRCTDLLRQACLLGGEWTVGEEWIEVANPLNGTLVGRLPRLGTRETEAAIDHADRARHSWARQPADARAAILRRWFDLMRQHRDNLATILTLEQGKPLREAKAEIDYAASYVEWFSEESRRVYGDLIPAPRQGTQQLVMREPVGFCAAITQG